MDPIERKWRVGPPTSGVPGSLYDRVRRILCSNGGRATRQEIFSALQADPFVEDRLAKIRSFNDLLSNMRHSGDVTIDGDEVTATGRTFRRLGLQKPKQF